MNQINSVQYMSGQLDQNLGTQKSWVIKRKLNSSLPKRIYNAINSGIASINDERTSHDFIKDKESLNEDLIKGIELAKSDEFRSINSDDAVNGVVRDSLSAMKGNDKDIKFAKKYGSLFKLREAAKNVKYNLNKNNYV